MTEEQYEVVDVNNLAKGLADSSWKVDIAKLPEEDVYETSIVPDGEMKKEVRPYWASVWLGYYEMYQQMICSYIKPKEDGANEEVSADNQTGYTG